MQVLVIIPTRGHFGYAKRAAYSLVTSLPQPARTDSQIAIIDDASDEWDTLDWADWPTVHRFHFKEPGGLTRSWNEGLRLAVTLGSAYTVCTNSDVLFSEDWFQPLAEALEAGFDLVGPLTNAPGHARWQSVVPFCYPATPLLDDSAETIESVASILRAKAIGPIEAEINGFFMMAKTETWWRGSFSDVDVFDPQYPMVDNEVQLQQRWSQQGFRVGIVPRSYIFHYRSVSRPEGLRDGLGDGAFRTLQNF